MSTNFKAGDLVRLPNWPFDKAATVLEIIEHPQGTCLRLATQSPEWPATQASGLFLAQGFEQCVACPLCGVFDDEMCGWAADGEACQLGPDA
jgi:hypothetical protein